MPFGGLTQQGGGSYLFTLAAGNVYFQVSMNVTGQGSEDPGDADAAAQAVMDRLASGAGMSVTNGQKQFAEAQDWTPTA